MDIPIVTDDSVETPPIDEELRVKQFKMYDDFALEQKKVLQQLGNDFIKYKKQKENCEQNLVQLWPLQLSAEEEQRRKDAEELRKSQIEERKKQEAERKAAEAAAAV